MLSATIQPKTCCMCPREFWPRNSFHVVCGQRCATKLANAAGAARKAAEKVERAQDRAKREKLKRIPELIAVAQKEFNAYIRVRDSGQTCICCGEPLGAGDVGGAYDCGHYRSTGSASHLRFDERNAHAQRKYCNRYGAGRAVDYRVGLIARIGLAAVEALEADNTPHKWERDELRQIAATYRAKLKELQRST